jgi:hypothetical protein
LRPFYQEPRPVNSEVLTDGRRAGGP